MSNADRDLQDRWPTLAPPLRPNAAIAKAVHAALGKPHGTTLLLGVTPELAELPRDILAIDWNREMVRIAWPGDTSRRRVVLGDWRTMPVAAGSMAAAMGDGSLMMLAFALECRAVLEVVRAILAPGGRIAFRCFASPNAPGAPNEIVERARAREFEGFHAFKLAFNMAVVATLADVTVSSAVLWRVFSSIVADRAEFCAATGWSARTVAEIDAYRGSPYLHSYPRRSLILAEARAVFPDARLIETCGYPLAERCPILIAGKP